MPILKQLVDLAADRSLASFTPGELYKGNKEPSYDQIVGSH